MSKNIENFTQTTSSTEEGKGKAKWWIFVLIGLAVVGIFFGTIWKMGRP